MNKCGKTSFDSLVISPSGKSYYFQISVPNFPSLKAANLKTCWNLLELLRQDNKLILEDVEQFSSIEDLFTTLKKIIDNVKEQTLRGPKFFITVFNELNDIGSNAEINGDFITVEFKRTDPAGRVHRSTVSLPSDYPLSSITILDHELPLGSSSTLGAAPNFSAVRTLKQFHHQFNNLVDIFQQFWDTMENFDSSCCIIEPQKPLRSDCYRRIQLTKSCSGLLTFNPYNPSQRPSIEFRGPDDEVIALRNTLESHLMENHWDPDVDVHLNLLSVLDLGNFASQEAADEFALVQVGECGICFEERLDGQAAVQRCDNSLCQSQYHQKCLLQYLSFALNSVRVINVVMGRCPTCKHMIACPKQ